MYRMKNANEKCELRKIKTYGEAMFYGHLRKRKKRKVYV